MSTISDLLKAIMSARYGKDVRKSIHDAIEQCYADATGNPESIAGHVGNTSNPHNVTAEQVGLGEVKALTTYSSFSIPNPSTAVFADWNVEIEIYQGFAHLYGYAKAKAALGGPNELYGLFNLTTFDVKPLANKDQIIPFDYPLESFVSDTTKTIVSPYFIVIEPSGFAKGCVDSHNLNKTGYFNITIPIEKV